MLVATLLAGCRALEHSVGPEDVGGGGARHVGVAPAPTDAMPADAMPADTAPVVTAAPAGAAAYDDPEPTTTAEAWSDTGPMLVTTAPTVLRAAPKHGAPAVVAVKQAQVLRRLQAEPTVGFLKVQAGDKQGWIWFSAVEGMSELAEGDAAPAPAVRRGRRFPRTAKPTTTRMLNLLSQRASEDAAVAAIGRGTETDEDVDGALVAIAASDVPDAWDVAERTPGTTGAASAALPAEHAAHAVIDAGRHETPVATIDTSDPAMEIRSVEDADSEPTALASLMPEEATGGVAAIEDSDLSEMRGRFVSGGKIVYFGLQLHTEWRVPDQPHTYSAGMDVNLDLPDGTGASSLATAQGDIRFYHSAATEGAVPETPSEGATESVRNFPSGAGTIQTITATGNQNVVDQSIGLSVSENPTARQVQRPSGLRVHKITESMQMQVAEGVTATAVVEPKNLQVILDMGDVGSVRQGVSGEEASRIGQQTNIIANHHNVTNTMYMHFQMQNQGSLRLGPGSGIDLLRGLPR